MLCFLAITLIVFTDYSSRSLQMLGFDKNKRTIAVCVCYAESNFPFRVEFHDRISSLANCGHAVMPIHYPTWLPQADTIILCLRSKVMVLGLSFPTISSCIGLRHISSMLNMANGCPSWHLEHLHLAL